MYGLTLTDAHVDRQECDEDDEDDEDVYPVCSDAGYGLESDDKDSEGDGRGEGGPGDEAGDESSGGGGGAEGGPGQGDYGTGGAGGVQPGSGEEYEEFSSGEDGEPEASGRGAPDLGREPGPHHYVQEDSEVEVASEGRSRGGGGRAKGGRKGKALSSRQKTAKLASRYIDDCA